MAPTPEDILKRQAVELAIMVDEGRLSKEVAEEVINRSAERVYEQPGTIAGAKKRADEVLKEKCDQLDSYRKKGYAALRIGKKLE